MATDTVLTYDSATNREELSDLISNISPMETPFQSRVSRRGTAVSIKPEWSLDTIATPDNTNRKIEGDDAVVEAQTLPRRLSNFTQISDKIYAVSGTQEITSKAGRNSEIAYLMGKNAKALKRDLEAMLTEPALKLGGTETTARSTGGLRAWIHSNTDLSTGAVAGVNALFTNDDLAVNDSQLVDGTQRAFLESMLKNVIRQAWTAGGYPTIIMCGPFNKVAISAFTGGSTRFDKSEDMTLYTNVDVYVSDFGRHIVVPNRFQRERDCFVLDPNLWEIAYLRGYRNYPLAKIGDSDRFQMITEYALKSPNEAGSGLIADLTDS